MLSIRHAEKLITVDKDLSSKNVKKLKRGRNEPKRSYMFCATENVPI